MQRLALARPCRPRRRRRAAAGSARRSDGRRARAAPRCGSSPAPPRRPSRPSPPPSRRTPWPTARAWRSCWPRTRRRRLWVALPLPITSTPSSRNGAELAAERDVVRRRHVGLHRELEDRDVGLGPAQHRRHPGAVVEPVARIARRAGQLRPRAPPAPARPARRSAGGRARRGSRRNRGSSPAAPRSRRPAARCSSGRTRRRSPWAAAAADPSVARKARAGRSFSRIRASATHATRRRTASTLLQSSHNI